MIVGKFHFKDYGFEDKRAVDEKGNPITSLDWTIAKAYAPYSWQRKFVNTILTNGVNKPKKLITQEDKVKALNKALGFVSADFYEWIFLAEEGKRSKKGMRVYKNKKMFYSLFGINEFNYYLIKEEQKIPTYFIKFFEQTMTEQGKEDLIKSLKTKFLIPEQSDEFCNICLDVMKFIKVSVYETNKMTIDTTEMVEITNKMIALSSKEPELKNDILKALQIIPLMCYVFLCNNDMIEGTEDTYSEAISISVDLQNIFKKI